MALILALVFYAVLPVAGAWALQRSWARFRQQAIAAIDAPEADFSLVQRTGPLPSGLWRLVGTLEAFEGLDRLWIGNPQVSVAVSLGDTPVYFLDSTPDPFAVGVEPPRRAQAASLGALPEGTQFLVAGALSRDPQGLVELAKVPGQDLLVIAFEGDPDTVLTRAVYAGRPLLDLWNSWTPVCLGLGCLLLLGWTYGEVRLPGNLVEGLVGLGLALLPSTFFLPPGIVFFYGFARLWAGARDQRARSDLARIRGHSIWAQEQASRAFRDEVAALVALFLGAVGNEVLLVVVLRLWVPG